MHNKQEELNPEHVLLKLSWTPVTQIYHIQILHWLHVPKSEERYSVSATFKFAWDTKLQLAASTK